MAEGQSFTITSSMFADSSFVKDITDKFDYTFICGDLNFRLDISRLHADWLISRQGVHWHCLTLC
jgi:hypothetical protein